MTIKVKTRNGVSRMKPEGEMTIYNAVSMKPHLIDTLHKCDRMEIDLAKVGEIDSAGFQLLLLAKREAGNLGKPLRLINHSQATLEILNLYRMAGNFDDHSALNRNGD